MTESRSLLKKAALIHLGCAKNLVDSEIMLGLLKKDGFAFVTDPKEADVVIVNTCGFIRPARDEADGILRRLVAGKAKRSDQILAVTGCYVEKERDKLMKAFPSVNVWLGVGGYDKIIPAVKGKAYRESDRTFLYHHRHPRLLSTPPTWAYVKISEGCSHHCSFCTIPSIKGRYRSRSVPSIVEEATALARLGIKEINLISQDTTYFGGDRGSREGLALLLRKLTGVKGIEWIRVLYGYPEEISDALLEVFRERKICPYLDIPFQHAEKKVVRSMHRGTFGFSALKLLDKIRSRVPDMAFRTSLIVGFPGEGAAEFHVLKQFVRDARFHHLGVFAYSPEPGTRAFRMNDMLTLEEKERRKSEIMMIQSEISLEHNKALVGTTVEVLIEKAMNGKDVFTGRTRRQAPEVDGVFILDAKGSSNLKKPLVKALVNEAGIYDLKGRLTP